MLKKQWKIFIGVLAIIVIYTATFVPLGIYYRIKNANPQNIGYLLIDENIDFKRLFLPGSGTEEDPYLIQNYHFTDQHHAILINGTTKCFIIQNCIISSSYFAIRLDNIKGCSVIIQNNNFLYCEYDIFIGDSNSIIVRSNSFNNSSYGVDLRSSTNIVVSENIFHNNTSGIKSYGSIFLTIEKNTVSNCQFGIIMHNTNNSFVKNNTCSYIEYAGMHLNFAENNLIANNTFAFCKREGFRLHRTNNNSISGNQFFSCGLNPFALYSDSYSRNKITNNWVNNKLLGYFENLTNGVFTEPNYGQLFFINCSNLVIKNQNLTSASLGLNLYRCQNTTIQNNVCNDNAYSGINVRDSQQMIIFNNTCNFNEREDSLFGKGIFASDITGVFLINNTCLSNLYGIDLDYSHNAIIANNTCVSSYHGFSISYCINASIYSNNFSKNLYGIDLWQSDFCEIIYNSFHENSRAGLDIGYGNNNTIHHNNFIENNLIYSGSQARDFGENNLWYDISTNEGNYWSDWLGVGNYTLDGSANAADLYPLDSPIIFAAYFPKILICLSKIY